MFDIKNIAAGGFDRAIIAMRRENGGREASDSEWQDVDSIGSAGQELTLKEFVIGPEDKEKCLQEIKAGRTAFLEFAVVWMHIEAPAAWWKENKQHFVARSHVKRKGENVKKSVMTTYAELHRLAESMLPGKGDNWADFIEMTKALEALPECWMILDGLEVHG